MKDTLDGHVRKWKTISNVAIYYDLPNTLEKLQSEGYTILKVWKSKDYKRETCASILYYRDEI